jgi:sRNA-binding protein
MRERFALQRRVRDLRDRLFADFPQTFRRKDGELRLLAVGIADQIIAVTGADPGTVDSLLYTYCNGYAYQRLVLNGEQRYNLDGTPAGKPQPQHKVHAIRELAKVRT